MSENREHGGKQKGAQDHAEGQHGSKAHGRFLEQLHEGASGDERNAEPQRGASQEGHHRLREDRQQHDEAEKNSEKNRSAIEVERGRETIDAERHERLK